MTQTSRFWNGTTLGDATAAPYDADTEFSKVLMSLAGAAAIPTNLSGVFTGELGELAVTGAATPLSVAAGRSLTWGTWFENDAALPVAIATPATSTRIDRIVVRKDWVAQTVRLVLLPGVEGGAAPALTQVQGTTWDEPIAQASITTGGVVTITDEREYVGASGGSGTGIGVLNSVYTSNGVANAWSANPTIATLTTTGAATIGGVANLNGNVAFPLATVINWNAGDITLTHSANTLTLAGGNLVGSGTPNITGFGTISGVSLGGAIADASQTNITTLGTLTALDVGGNITMTAALSRLVPGATSFAIRNNANAVDNFLIDNAGNVTILGSVTAASFSGGFTLAGNLDMSNNLILNIGAAGTDFTAGGGLTLAIGLIVTSGGIRLTGNILDSTGAALLSTTAIASAVNSVNVTNSITATPPIISPAGTDTNIDLRISAKGTGAINLNAGVYETIQTYSPGVAGTATLDLSLGDIHHITMPAGNITIALSNAKAGQIFMVRILQDGTGSRTVTWFATIKWAAGGTAPVLTTTASKADTFLFECTGAGTYDGYVGAQNI